ncbi:hypothetical protein [Actinomadura darangshiensis]|nr:hypothetical protein [Actinomadura darangshiensis]
MSNGLDGTKKGAADMAAITAHRASRPFGAGQRRGVIANASG